MNVSVVTVCLNSELTIARTIESFLAQDYSAKELIVIDGGSTDRTLEIVHGFKDSRIRVHSGPDLGMYDAMNKGLALYSGDAIGFLNSDDRFHDDVSLGAMAAGLANSDAVYGDLVILSPGAAQRKIRTWNAGHYRKGSFRRGWMPPHPTFYIRRELANRVGTFDLRFGSAADYDFMLRALELGNPRVTYVHRVLIDFSHGGVSTSSLRNYIRANALCLKSRREHLHAPALDMALILKLVRKLHQFRSFG
jgi:glycosyltransferase